MEAPRPTRRRALLAAAIAAVALGVGLGAAPVSAMTPDDSSASWDATGVESTVDSYTAMAPVDPSVTEISIGAETLDGSGGNSRDDIQRGFGFRPRG